MLLHSLPKRQNVFQDLNINCNSKNFFFLIYFFSKNPNTVKSMLFWQNVWEMWCKQNEPEKLNKLAETFYAEVEKENR